MSLEENRATVRRFIEALNRKDLDSLDNMVSPDYVEMNLRGWESVRLSLRMFRFLGFPDLHATIEDVIAEGDKVWVRIRETGTHTGEYGGLAPTGKKITTRTVNIFRIVDGKIVEKEAFRNSLDFYKQLGVIEFTKRAKTIFHLTEKVLHVLEFLYNISATESGRPVSFQEFSSIDQSMDRVCDRSTDTPTPQSLLQRLVELGYLKSCQAEGSNRYYVTLDGIRKCRRLMRERENARRQLAQLKEKLRKGAITQDEYEQKEKGLLIRSWDPT